MKNLLTKFSHLLPTRGELIQATTASFLLLLAAFLLLCVDENGGLL